MGQSTTTVKNKWDERRGWNLSEEMGQPFTETIHMADVERACFPDTYFSRVGEGFYKTKPTEIQSKM